MASLDRIATAFIDYKYDEAVGFEGIDGIPCLACVATIDHDVRCRCLVNESGDTSCLLCDRNETVCDLAGANLSLEEVRDRIAAVQPAYTSTGKSVGTLRDSLVRLSSAEAVVVFSVQERDSDSLPRNLPNYVVKPMIMTRVLAPRYAVVYSGGMPIYSGQK